MGRISDWRARRKQFEPAGHRVGGGMAEVRLSRLVRSVSGDAKVWDGLRIPDLENNGRREIDMVIAGKEETLFVEQKHWSGELNFKDGCFLQTQRSGNIIDHGDIHSWTERTNHKSICFKSLMYWWWLMYSSCYWFKIMYRKSIWEIIAIPTSDVKRV